MNYTRQLYITQYHRYVYIKPYYVLHDRNCSQYTSVYSRVHEPKKCLHLSTNQNTFLSLMLFTTDKLVIIFLLQHQSSSIQKLFRICIANDLIFIAALWNNTDRVFPPGGEAPLSLPSPSCYDAAHWPFPDCRFLIGLNCVACCSAFRLCNSLKEINRARSRIDKMHLFSITPAVKPSLQCFHCVLREGGWVQRLQEASFRPPSFPATVMLLC